MGILCANPDEPVYCLKVKAGEPLKETRKEIIWWPLVLKQNLHPKKFRFWAYILDKHIMNIQ